MGRAGYNEDCEDWWQHIRWRGAVTSAFRGKRGQAFLREMLAALEALPEKRLISEELVTVEGEVCALGSVAKARSLDTSDIDPYDHDTVATKLNVAGALAREIMYENDEYRRESPEQRYDRMYRWIKSEIR